MKRARKSNLNFIDAFVLSAVLQVYTENGLVAEFSVDSKDAEGRYHVSGVQKQGATTLQLLQLVTIVRNVLQERVSRDISRADIYIDKATAPQAGQLEMPGLDEVSLGDTPKDDTPF